MWQPYLLQCWKAALLSGYRKLALYLAHQDVEETKRKNMFYSPIQASAKE